MERHVHPGRADHLLARDALRLACEQADRVDAIAADVHHRAAVELGERAHVRQVLERERERRLDDLEAPDRAAGDEVANDGGLRMVAVHEGLHQHAPRRVGGGERRLGLGGAARVRLLHEHVLARLERVHRPLVVHPVRQADVDGLHVVVGEERLVRAVRALDAVLGGIGLRLRAVAAPNRDELDAVGLARPTEDLRVDRGGGEQTEAERIHGRDSYHVAGVRSPRWR